jgi:hypothetical protein
MIKFFRNIRKTLFSEGKTGTYLKYAIGEIVLVMIGILLAIQVNNWNDERKAKIETEAKRQSNLEEIYNDLKKDYITLDNIINHLKRQKEASAYILRIVESEDKYVSDSLTFIENQFIAASSVTVERTKNTWDNLNTSGQLLSLKDEELNTKLFDYYTFYDSRIKNFNELPKEARLEFRISTGPCDKLENHEIRQEGTGLILPNYNWFSCYLNLEEAFESLVSIYISSYHNITWFEQLKTHAQSIIEYMEQNYSKLKQ